MSHSISKKSSWMALAFHIWLSNNLGQVSALSTSTPSKGAVVASPVISNKAVSGLKHGMDYTKLGSSDLIVSKVCMGTMTFGKQNTLEEGVQSVDIDYDNTFPVRDISQFLRLGS